MAAGSEFRRAHQRTRRVAPTARRRWIAPEPTLSMKAKITQATSDTTAARRVSMGLRKREERPIAPVRASPYLNARTTVGNLRVEPTCLLKGPNELTDVTPPRG